MDDFEPSDPLKSHSQQYKISGMYCSIAGCPNELSSKLCNIFMTQIFYASDSKRFTYKRLLQPSIGELNYISQEGIIVNNPPLPRC